MLRITNALATQKFTYVEGEDNFKYNAPHHFRVNNAETNESICKVDFQEGPVGEVGVNGVFNEDLIIMVIERLKCFQSSDFACRENELALQKLEEALMWLRMRTLDREARGVQGTYKK